MIILKKGGLVSLLFLKYKYGCFGANLVCVWCKPGSFFMQAATLRRIRKM